MRIYFLNANIQCPISKDTVHDTPVIPSPWGVVVLTFFMCSRSLLKCFEVKASIQLSELERCRVKKLAQAFNTTAQDLNPGTRSRESEALPLSQRALCTLNYLCRHYT